MARGAWDRIHLPYCDRDRARLPDGCGFSCRAFIKQTRPESGLKLGMVSAALSYHSEMGNAAVSTSHGSRIASDFHSEILLTDCLLEPLWIPRPVCFT